MDHQKSLLLIIAVSSACTTLLSAAGVVLTHRSLTEMKADIREQLATVNEAKTDLDADRKTTLVTSESVLSECFADNSSATCTVTNLSSDPITTCLRGKVSQKKAGGVQLLSLPVCTGRLGAQETRAISAPWKNGFARDICNSTDRFGNEILDWQACNFTAENVAPK